MDFIGNMVSEQILTGDMTLNHHLICQIFLYVARVRLIFLLHMSPLTRFDHFSIIVSMFIFYENLVAKHIQIRLA